MSNSQNGKTSDDLCYSSRQVAQSSGGLLNCFLDLEGISRMMQSSEVRRSRLVGIDSIRFVCALTVMCGHLGLVNIRPLASDFSGFQSLAIGLYNNLFNGPAAVIVFFIISGFCINYPFSSGKRALDLGGFYSRRFLRIGPPAIVFFSITRYVLRDPSSPIDTALWSVVCEGIYYLLFPLLRYVRSFTSWAVMIAVSSVLSVILIVERSGALSKGYYSLTALGMWTWIIGMPSWLAGCWLAENYSKFRVLSRTSMRAVRCLIFAISVMVSILHFHIRGPWASNVILLSIFAAPATLWMGFEISYFKVHNPWPRLERAGLWSYSLYLVHPLFAGFIFMKYPTTSMPRLVLLTLCLVASYVFYLLIEWPSHKLAQAAGRSVLFNRVAGERSRLEGKA